MRTFLAYGGIFAVLRTVVRTVCDQCFEVACPQGQEDSLHLFTRFALMPLHPPFGPGKFPQCLQQLQWDAMWLYPSQAWCSAQFVQGAFVASFERAAGLLQR